MLLSSLKKKIGCKRLMRVTNLFRGVVSQLNGGGYSSRDGRKHHIHLLESAYSINQNYQRRS